MGKLIDFQKAIKPSQLEEEYVSRYGIEFVNDLKDTYRWMMDDMRSQPKKENVANLRRKLYHRIGDWDKYFYVDFHNECLIAQTIDDMDLKTIFNYGQSKILRAYDNNDNIKYLLSGMYCYNSELAKKWLHKLVGSDGKILIEET